MTRDLSLKEGTASTLPCPALAKAQLTTTYLNLGGSTSHFYQVGPLCSSRVCPVESDPRWYGWGPYVPEYSSGKSMP